MAAINILAQLDCPANVETLLFQAAARSKALVQELAVCNRVAAPGSFRLSVSLNGAATNVKDYLYYNLPINGNDTFASELGLTLNSFDVIRVFTLTGNLTFTLIGNPT